MEERARVKAPRSDAGFDDLFRTHHRAVLAYCARRTSRADAWDAASEVFLVAWRRFGDVPASDEARPWLLGVAYRVLANQRRSALRRRMLLQKAASRGENSTPLSDEPVLRSEEESEAIAALSRLRPADREVLLLSLWEELPPIEISKILHISREAVDQRYSRAKRRLGQELGREQTVKGRATRMTSGKGGAT